MRNIHFSRNPKIAAFLKDYGYGKEFLEKFPRKFPEKSGDDQGRSLRNHR